MEWFLRVLAFLVKLVYFVVNPLLQFLLPRRQDHQIPPIRKKLLSLSLVYLLKLLRWRQLKSRDLVAAYIERIKEVNPCVNAVVEDRFEEALKEAERADDLIAKTRDEIQLQALFSRYPLLGVPFTVKESCGLKGMSQVVGNLQRVGERSTNNGAVVELMRSAGAIPLLVSANPEFCFSIESNSYTHGICRNPYDSRRTAGGSSGGEGALNGAGATTFGIGSDLAGSIRIPCLFNGVFGHKPTAGVTSVRGHFPNSSDPEFSNCLQIGPITRFGRDLPLLMQIMAGENALKLNLMTPVETKDLKIYYSMGFSGLNGLLRSSVTFDIELAIMKAVKYFENMGLPTTRARIQHFHNSLEIGLSAIVRLQDFPFLINTDNEGKIWETLCEFVKSLGGRSKYTKEGLMFEQMRRANSYMPARNLAKYKEEAELLKAEIIELLGTDSVLFFPTFHTPAVHINSSILPLWGIDYSLVFNVLGLPATHVPMGLDGNGLPVGFQVVAAPYQDRLCLQIAGELEAGFGGWVPPTKHDF